MTTDPKERDDALPDEWLRALRDERMPPATVEAAVVNTLRDRSVLPAGIRRTRMLPWLVAASAVAVAFFIGVQFGERRAAETARLTALTPPPASGQLSSTTTAAAARSDLVLWF